MNAKQIWFVLAFATAGLSSTATAQPTERPDRTDRTVERLDARLDLTDTQAQQLAAVLAQHRDAAVASREAQRGQRLAHAEALDASILALLTPAQAEAYATLNAERRGFRKGVRQGARANGRSSHRPQQGILNRLDLTEAQRDQLRTVRDHARTEMSAWRTANPDASAEDQRAFRQRLRTATQGQIKSILTPEQWQTWEQQQQRREGREGRRGPRR